MMVSASRENILPENSFVLTAQAPQPNAEQEEQQPAQMKKYDSTSGLNDETKDDVNSSSAVDNQTPINHIIGQYDSETSLKQMQLN